MTKSFPIRDVVLWGVGHTHAHVLWKWRNTPIPGARLTCVSNFAVSTYSGMLPGVLAGRYPRKRMELDLVRMCAAAGARLIVGNATGLGANGRELVVEGRPPLPFDALSIGVGSVPSTRGVEIAGENVVAIKPMPSFLDRLADRLGRVGGRRVRLAVVGGGAGGVEIAYCSTPYVRQVLGAVAVEVALVEAGDRLVAGAYARTNDLIQGRLSDRGVVVRLGRCVARVQDGMITLSDGGRIAADVVVWATGAVAPAVLGGLGLPVDGRGFLLTRPTLRSVSDVPIFAVGDCGTIAGSETPKAGVFAVRQGPVLWRNLAATLEGRALEPYRPQESFLRLLNTGDGRAIGEYRGFTFEGRWCRRLKDYIDGRFMDQYQNL